MTQHAEGAYRVAKGGRGLLGGPPLDEVGAQRLVLAVFRVGGFEEEAAALD